MVDSLVKNGEKYVDTLETHMSENSFCRERSWGHCYRIFSKYIGKAKELDAYTLDYLALHLATYLSSWGMYRGSSFLLKETDYKVHIDVVKIILKDKYTKLYNAFESEKVLLLVELAKEIDSYYQGVRGFKTKTSSILISKILLGTLGCTPAYDRAATKALKELEFSATFGEKSLVEVFKHYEQNREKYKDFLERLSKAEGIEADKFPPMKMLDVCLWQYGMNCMQADK